MSGFQSKWGAWKKSNTPEGGSAKSAISPSNCPSGTNGTSIPKGISVFEASTDGDSDDLLAQCIVFKIAEAKAVQEVSSAWDALTDAEKCRIPSEAMSDLVALAGTIESLSQLKKWRDREMQIICESKHSRNELLKHLPQIPEREDGFVELLNNSHFTTIIGRP